MLGLIVAALIAGALAQDVPQRQSVEAGERSVSGRRVLADGHVDLGPRLVDGRWTIQLRDDAPRPPVWRELGDVVLVARDAARVELPDDPAYAFLGRPGARVWLLPQVQQEGVLWPGWNTQAPEVVRRVRREVTWRLLRVRGPGHFVLFLNGAFGAPQMVFDSAKPLPQETGIDVDTHVHGNWVFSAPGTYLLEVEMEGAKGTLRFFAGPGDAQAAFAAGGGEGGGAARIAALGLAAAAVLAAAYAVARRAVA